MMICLICRKADIIGSPASVSFQRGEMHLVINHVPARICRSCGETYVDEEVAVQLLKVAAEAADAGILEDVIEYNSFTSNGLHLRRDDP